MVECQSLLPQGTSVSNWNDSRRQRHDPVPEGIVLPSNFSPSSAPPALGTPAFIIPAVLCLQEKPDRAHTPRASAENASAAITIDTDASGDSIASSVP